MKYRPLASTGLHVSCLGYGAQNFGGAGHALYGLLGGIDAQLADRIIGRLVDAGVNLIDTADSYGDGEAEQLLGEVLGERREQVLLCTKAGNRTAPGVNDVGLSRVHLMHSLDASLRRLRTDRIDLYLLHSFDPLTALDDVLRTLDDSVRQGKVRYVGCSNFAAWQIERAFGISALRQLEPFICIEAYYSLLGRDIEREIAPLASDRNIPIIAWGTLAGGFLTGKFTRGRRPDDQSRRLRFEFPPIDVERGYDIVDVAAAVAERHQATVPQVALAWAMGQPFVGSVLFGARDVAQVDDNLMAAELELTEEDRAELDAASHLASEYPQWLFERAMARFPGESRDWSKAVSSSGE